MEYYLEQCHYVITPIERPVSSILMNCKRFLKPALAETLFNFGRAEYSLADVELEPSMVLAVHEKIKSISELSYLKRKIKERQHAETIPEE